MTFYDATIEHDIHPFGRTRRIADPQRKAMNSEFTYQLQQPSAKRNYLAVHDERDNTVYEGVHLLSRSITHIDSDGGKSTWLHFERRDIQKGSCFKAIPLEQIRTLQVLG